MKTLALLLISLFTFAAYADKSCDVYLHMKVDFNGASVGAGVNVTLYDIHHQIIANRVSDNDGLVFFEGISIEEFELFIEDPLSRFETKNIVCDPRGRKHEITEPLVATALYAQIEIAKQWETINENYPEKDNLVPLDCKLNPDVQDLSENEDLARRISLNLEYPNFALEMFQQGRVVAQFIIELDGQISNFEIIQSATPSLDMEVSRLFQSLGTVQPLSCDGVTYRAKCIMPVDFSLD